MNDDFNSPAAVATLFDLARSINRARMPAPERSEIETGWAVPPIIGLPAVLGFELESDDSSGRGRGPFIDLLVQVRDRLRAEKQWGLSDLIRDQLAEKGITIADGPTGVDLASELTTRAIAALGNEAATNGSMAGTRSANRSRPARRNFRHLAPAGYRRWRSPARRDSGTGQFGKG